MKILRPVLVGAVLVGALSMVSTGLRAAGPVLLLDNFDEDKTENALGGATGAWMDPEDKSQGCTASRVQLDRLGSLGRSLRLDFDIESQRENIRVPTNFSVASPAVALNQAFNGYYSVFPAQDLRPYNYLIFWAKGDATAGYTRSFKLEIKDGLSSGYKGFVVDGLGTEWRRFVVPLRDFADIKDWGAVKEFVIVFAADAVTRKNGTVYIDDVYFAQNPDNNLTLPEREMTARHAEKPVTLDGKPSEWPRRDFIDLSPSEFVESGARGLRDAGARFAVQWDEQWLYLTVDLEDNEIQNGEEGESLWKGDVVELYVNPTGPVFTWGDPSAFQLGFSPVSASGVPGRWAWFQRRAPKENEARYAWDKKKHTAEIAVAWSFLGVTPGVNRDLGFSIAFHDKDSADGTPEAKLQWSFQSLGGKKARLGKLVLK